MALEKRIVPQEHHDALLEKGPGKKGFFNSKAEAEAAATDESWVAVKGDGNGKPIDKNGVVLEAVRPTGYTAEEWVESPRLKRIVGLVAEAAMPDIPAE